MPNELSPSLGTNGCCVGPGRETLRGTIDAQISGASLRQEHILHAFMLSCKIIVCPLELGECRY